MELGNDIGNVEILSDYFQHIAVEIATSKVRGFLSQFGLKGHCSTY
jgi:hypothetical protein